MLATDAESPEVTETTVSTDLLQSLEIVTEFRVNTVGEDLVVFAIDDILLSVEEPCGDFELGGVLDDSDNSLQLVGVEVTSTRKKKYTIRSKSPAKIRMERTAC